MANANISVPHPQFKDKISTSERLSICGLNCVSKKHPVTRYRSEKENRKHFRQFFYSSQTALS